MGKKKFGQSPRDESEKITQGETKPHHIGKMSFQVLQAEIVSLRNTKPMFRNSKWKKRAAMIGENIEKLDNKVNALALKELLRATVSGET